MPVAAHNGTEFFAIDFGNDCITYYPVPGGVVMHFFRTDFAPSVVFIPMARLLYDIAEDSAVINVRLESTMAQLMQASALAGMAAAIGAVEEGG